ncbi:MAG: hypothetical protein MZV63_53985 [Marinilabiliales bacterium]|nr:hypothetical protein [Marinilabiliales bacterium]
MDGRLLRKNTVMGAPSQEVRDWRSQCFSSPSPCTLFKFIGTEFMPTADESRVTATVELQTGTRVDVTEKVADRIDSIVTKAGS